MGRKRARMRYIEEPSLRIVVDFAPKRRIPMREDKTNAEPLYCHDCGATHIAAPKCKKSPARTCAYCGAPKRTMKRRVDCVLDELLSGN